MNSLDRLSDERSDAQHRKLLALEVEDIGKKIVRGGAFIDVKAVFDAKKLREAGMAVWRL